MNCCNPAAFDVPGEAFGLKLLSIAVIIASNLGSTPVILAAASRRSLYPEYPLPGLPSGKLFTSPPVPFPGLSIKPNDSFTLVYAPVAASFTMLPNAVALVTTLSA